MVYSYVVTKVTCGNAVCCKKEIQHIKKEIVTAATKSGMVTCVRVWM